MLVSVGGSALAFSLLPDKMLRLKECKVAYKLNKGSNSSFS